MTRASANPEAEKIPEAKIRSMKYPFPFIWIVPLFAAIFAGYLFYGRYQSLGPAIIITFDDLGGVKADQTPLQHRGVEIGMVEDVRLDSDLRKAVVKVRLNSSAEALAKKGSLFWIVRPDVGENMITGLGTIFTGPYIDSQPGSGEPTREFSGLGKAPVAAIEGGLKIRLRTPYLDRVGANSPIYYRGVQVGSVETVEISSDAMQAEAHALIRRPYAKLISNSTKFWTVGGADVHGSLFRGLNLKIESLRSLVIGGVAFATPDDPGMNARDGAVFDLADKADKEWLAWAPKIPLSEVQIKQSKNEDEAEEAKAIGPALIKREK